MKTSRHLYLLRHARAGAARPGQSDYDRPLDEKGHADSKALGRLLMDRGMRFDTVISSGAVRTRQTWKGVAQAGFDVEAQFDDSLYEGGAEAYGAAFTASTGAHVLLVGHNPMIGEEARRLAASAGTQAAALLEGGMPKAALAVFRIAGEAGDEVELVAFLRPPFAA